MERRFTKYPSHVTASDVSDAVIAEGRYSHVDIDRKFSIIDEMISVTSYTLREHNTKGEFEIIAVDEEFGLYCFTEESLRYTIDNKDEFTWYRLKQQ